MSRRSAKAGRAARRRDRHASPIVRSALLIAIAKARGWIDDIRLGRFASFVEIAEREVQGERHIRLLAPLALSPRIIAAIVDGTAPSDLTVIGLAKALRPRRSGNPSFPTKPRLIAATAGPRNPPVIPRSTSAMSTGVKLGQSARIRAAQAIVATPSATSGRFDLTTSSSSPPGTWINNPVRPLTVRTNPFYFCPTSPRQIQGDKRPESGQYPRENQVQPVQTAQALLRGVVLG